MSEGIKAHEPDTLLKLVYHVTRMTAPSDPVQSIPAGTTVKVIRVRLLGEDFTYMVRAASDPPAVLTVSHATVRPLTPEERDAENSVPQDPGSCEK